MREPLIRRITHGVVHDPKLKLLQFCSLLQYGEGEEDQIIVRSAIYPEYVETDDGWFYLCSVGMRHTSAMLNRLCYGDGR